jgi:hypothetical protein
LWRISLVHKVREAVESLGFQSDDRAVSSGKLFIWGASLIVGSLAFFEGLGGCKFPGCGHSDVELASSNCVMPLEASSDYLNPRVQFITISSANLGISEVILLFLLALK